MISGYSASKSRNLSSFLDLQNVIYSSQMLDVKNSYQEHRRMSSNRRQQSNQKSRFVEQDKQNYNIQRRLERYDTPTHSPIRKTYISPIKQNYDRMRNRKANVRDVPKKQINIEQSQGKFNGYGQNKQNTYNYSANKYQCYKKNVPLPTPKRSSIVYQTDFQNQREADYNEQVQPYSARVHYQPNNNFNITFSNRCMNINSTTPKKPKIETQQQILQKTEFLRQRMERVNRMTPKGTSIKIQKSQQISPQKFIQKQQFSSTIVKYNKYCDQKLPLQTIYDAQENKLQLISRQPTQQAQAQNGLQQINSLSKKISQRLRQIINRHSN